MSLKNQIAFGKNIILQKRCDQACDKYKSNLRQSRRRINALEEDCVKSLYRLLLDAKDGQNDQKPNSTAVKKQDTHNVRRAKSAVHGYRPASTEVATDQQERTVYRRPSTTALKNYQISYSFVKDGMDISKNRIGSKIHKQNNVNKQETAINSAYTNLYTSPVGAKPEIKTNDKTEDSEINSTLEIQSPKDAEDNVDLKPAAMLNRPQIRNSLQSTGISTCISNDNNNSLKVNKESENLRKSMSDLDEISKVAHLQIRPVTAIGHATEINSFEKDDKQQYRAVIKVTVPNANEDNYESSDYESVSPAFETKLETTYSPLGDAKEEIMNLEVDSARDGALVKGSEQAQSLILSPEGKTLRCRSSIARINPRPKSRKTRPRSMVKSSSFITEEPDILQQTAEKTQCFLKNYAKKSKLFSYVVNSASTVQRDRKIYRSPCVTYQELVSIKAGIRKQLLNTRIILQKSARLSSYVDKITGQVNRRIERLEELYYESCCRYL